MAGIAEFLDQLASDEELLEAYLHDPEGTVDRSGLSANDRDLILRGNVRDIREALEAEVGPKPYIIVRIVRLTWGAEQPESGEEA